ncbi:undecaprenyldiphospho-muramoylpentapeptide beta-N-acetylglucosaminyltransferase [bacterium]|jgi:UDP-N-acetylglucosamine--N-acetylmuramyl-(pentapeptide) pyrophosphoryl-undecaprenol N-acetylglucosamine transferase|nr:undecaprenyldiphospho-muramoylpentapeptide beta-N-acetylglucosaminyltransferase [bacterium]
MSTNKRLLVAGGGTGGHVLAGIAIADEWIRQESEWVRQESETSPASLEKSVLFIGAAQGLEARLVPRHGYRVRLLKIGALNRVSLRTRLLTLLQLPLSFLKAFFLILLFRPHAVIGVGGYASGPVVLLARFLSSFLRIHTAIIEQNSVAGFTNRMLGRWVHTVFCAFEDAARLFDPMPDSRRVKVTGNPIRSSLTRLPPSGSDPFTIFIFGGSQGALGINTMVLDSLPYLKNHGIRFIHQTGVKDYERVAAGYAREGVPARIERFIDDMGSCYREASLVICRAGASSMTELASVGRAPIFIPLPTAADNHQEKNARIFEQGKAAWVVPQGSLTGEAFAARILALKADPAQIHAVEEAIRSFYRPDSAELIVKTLRGFS